MASELVTGAISRGRARRFLGFVAALIVLASMVLGIAVAGPSDAATCFGEKEAAKSADFLRYVLLVPPGQEDRAKEFESAAKKRDPRTTVTTLAVADSSKDTSTGSTRPADLAREVENEFDNGAAGFPVVVSIGQKSPNLGPTPCEAVILDTVAEVDTQIAEEYLFESARRSEGEDSDSKLSESVVGTRPGQVDGTTEVTIAIHSVAAATRYRLTNLGAKADGFDVTGVPADPVTVFPSDSSELVLVLKPSGGDGSPPSLAKVVLTGTVSRSPTSEPAPSSAEGDPWNPHPDGLEVILSGAGPIESSTSGTAKRAASNQSSSADESAAGSPAVSASEGPSVFVLAGLVLFGLVLGGAGVYFLGSALKPDLFAPGTQPTASAMAQPPPSGSFVPPGVAPPPSPPLPAWPRPAAPPLPGPWVRFAGTEPFIQIVERDEAMKIRPRQIDAGLVWSAAVDGVMGLAVWTEKIARKGEDAEPSFLFDSSMKRGFLATYDGSGGAGSAPARRRLDGTEVSGAYVGARVAREATEVWFRSPGVAVLTDTVAAEQLHDELQAQLAFEMTQCIPSSGRISGSLRRDLPTTLAAIAYEIDPNGGVTAVSLWAGDSRTHVLTPDHGLQQMMVDDAPVADALETLINDAPMSNLVCADRPFVINQQSVAMYAPVILISATDGCFGYVATPAHYEHLLLRCLQRASSVDEWAELITTELAGFTSDDASLALVAVGFDDFAHVQASFAARAAMIEVNHWLPFDGLSPDDHETFAAARLESWLRYKPGYEQLIGHVEPSTPRTEPTTPAGEIPPSVDPLAVTTELPPLPTGEVPDEAG